MASIDPGRRCGRDPRSQGVPKSREPEWLLRPVPPITSTRIARSGHASRSGNRSTRSGPSNTTTSARGRDSQVCGFGGVAIERTWPASGTGRRLTKESFVVRPWRWSVHSPSRRAGTIHHRISAGETPILNLPTETTHVRCGFAKTLTHLRRDYSNAQASWPDPRKPLAAGTYRHHAGSSGDRATGRFLVLTFYFAGSSLAMNFLGSVFRSSSQPPQQR